MAKDIKIIDAYLEHYPHYREFIEILKDIFILRQQTASEHSENIFSVDGTAAEKKLSAEKSLVDMAQDKFNTILPQKYFLQLLLIGKMKKLDQAEKIRNKMMAGDLQYEELIRKSFTIPKTTHITGVEDEEVYDLMNFLLQESMHPFFASLAQEYKTLIADSKWSKGRCPVCGQETTLSFLRAEEEGKRYLFCAQCNFDWPVKRIQCPFCENEVQEQLGFFTVGDDEKYRVDICHQCKKYIKTIDTRKTSDGIDPEVENLITLHLDILALKEGYF